MRSNLAAVAATEKSAMYHRNAMVLFVEECEPVSHESTDEPWGLAEDGCIFWQGPVGATCKVQGFLKWTPPHAHVNQ